MIGVVENHAPTHPAATVNEESEMEPPHDVAGRVTAREEGDMHDDRPSVFPWGMIKTSRPVPPARVQGRSSSCHGVTEDNSATDSA